eukprot:gene14781-biopygen1947
MSSSRQDQGHIRRCTAGIEQAPDQTAEAQAEHNSTQGGAQEKEGEIGSRTPTCTILTEHSSEVHVETSKEGEGPGTPHILPVVCSMRHTHTQAKHLDVSECALCGIYMSPLGLALGSTTTYACDTGCPHIFCTTCIIASRPTTPTERLNLRGPGEEGEFAIYLQRGGGLTLSTREGAEEDTHICAIRHEDIERLLQKGRELEDLRVEDTPLSTPPPEATTPTHQDATRGTSTTGGDRTTHGAALPFRVPSEPLGSPGTGTEHTAARTARHSHIAPRREGETPGDRPMDPGRERGCPQRDK